MKVAFGGIVSVCEVKFNQSYIEGKLVFCSLGFVRLVLQNKEADSTYHVQNGNYRTCGEIVAVSLAQGGPPPYFLEQCAYGSMLNSVDMVNIQEAELTIKEQKLLNDVRLQELHRHNLGAWLHWNN